MGRGEEGEEWDEHSLMHVYVYLHIVYCWSGILCLVAVTLVGLVTRPKQLLPSPLKPQFIPARYIYVQV